MTNDEKNDPQLKPHSWKQIQGDLQSALNLWEDLDQKSKNNKSFEEKQIEEVRSLLKNLQDKLQELT